MDDRRPENIIRVLILLVTEHNLYAGSQSSVLRRSPFHLLGCSLSER